jgi:cytochrome c peroxidase
MFQCTRPRFARLALAVSVLAGIFSLLLAPSPQAQYELPEQSPEQFILSLAAGIDQAVLTPRERLGLRLFFDSNLSEPAGTACASCHDPRRAFTGNNSTMIGVAQGSRSDQFGTRDAPTVMYLATAPRFSSHGSLDKDGKRVPVGGLFWDGRADTLEEQAKQPFFNPVEMNNADTPALITKVAKSAYAAEFRKEWGDAIFANPEKALDAVAASIAAFERTHVFQPFTAKFDYVMRGEAKFTEQEQRGLSLFTIRQKGNCAECHIVDAASRDPRKSLFTDFSYRALGLPRSKRIPKNADPAFIDLGLCERVPVTAPTPQATASKPPITDPAACGLFKTPTLRNITITAPYMHNGFFDHLRDTVAFYATRDTDPASWFPEGKKFNDLPAQYHANVDVDTPPYQRRPQQRPQLTNAEIDDIVAFLYTLTDGYKTAQGRSVSRPQSEIAPPRSSVPSPSPPASRGEY